MSDARMNRIERLSLMINKVEDAQADVLAARNAARDIAVSMIEVVGDTSNANGMDAVTLIQSARDHLDQQAGILDMVIFNLDRFIRSL